MKKSVAVIGTGIAGMAAGFFLRRGLDVTFYEKEPRPGGHTNTVIIEEDGRQVPIDTGFIVYNEVTYPNLVRFFKLLEVPTKPTSMSFSVQHVSLGLEYCGTGVSGLFAQRRNLFNPRFWRLLGQIGRFNKECVQILDDPSRLGQTIGDYAAEKKFGDDFLDHYLVPMASAVWSTPPGLMLDFPAATLVRFFKNHGLLGLTTHYEWRTVDGGSRVYRDKILLQFPEKVMLSNPAVRVRRQGEKVRVQGARGPEQEYDFAVFACHADEALAALAEPTALERSLLGKFRYQPNRVVLHTDASVMPRTRRAWSSWNYRIEGNAPSTTYWMNSLQQVSDKKDYFITVNDPGGVDPARILWQREYTHPLFDVDAVRAQDGLAKLNQDGRIFFCGSYFRYGFHEDALSSALEAVRALTGREAAWA